MDFTCQLLLSIEPEVSEKKRKKRSSSAMSTCFSQHQEFLERMQEKQNQWAEAQLLHSQEREERLLSNLMDISSRNTERLVSLLVEGLRAPPPQFPTQLLSHPPHLAPWTYMQPSSSQNLNLPPEEPHRYHQL